MIPTNIITGFLGVGKTTAIVNLLRNKPAGERWAVLVNEFGEIGIDSKLIQGQHTPSQDLVIREVAGGCICCAAGLSLQVALNQLLHKRTIDRLLIEPTGLGHPRQILNILSGQNYCRTLTLQQVITLIDARHLNDTRYTNNDTFQQQLDIADVIVANKSDLYSPQDHHRVTTYFEHRKNTDCPVVLCKHGELDVSYLNGKTKKITPVEQHSSSSHRHETHKSPTVEQMPMEGFIKKINQGAGFVSVGWRFREDIVFDRNKVFAMLSGIRAERAKAVMNTDEGIRGYNLATGTLSEVSLFGGGQSCIEIISKQIDENWETDLLACVAETALAD